MNYVVLAARWIIRLCGVAALSLGLLFWTNNYLVLVPVHMLLGLSIVLALWTLAICAGLAGVDWRLVVLALVWGAIVPVLGVMQGRLLPGSLHWIVQVIHLLVGLGALALGERLARGIALMRRPAPAT